MMNSRVNYEFKKIVKELAKLRGQGTELISIYIPPNYQISEVTNKLREEAGQAMNIKSKQTRKNVTAAIERLLNALKAYRKPPENGLVLFAGNINDKIELFKLEPPEPVPIQTYRCDSTFFLEPLLEMLEPKEAYGLLTVDRREATIAILKGKRIEIVRSMTSQVPGKHRAGGQCVHEDSLIQLGNGIITEIKNVQRGDAILSHSNYKTKIANCSHVFSRKRRRAYVIKTKYPTLEIIVTPEHLFFVPDLYGITVRYAEDLKPGNQILVAKCSPVRGREVHLNIDIPHVEYPTKQGINYLTNKRRERGLSQQEVAKILGVAQATISKFETNNGKISHDKIMELIELYGVDKKAFSQKFMKKTPAFRFPKTLTKELAQLLGYISGDGYKEEYRICLCDSDINLLRKYMKLIKLLFGVSVSIDKRRRRGCYRLAFYGKELVKTIDLLFGEVFYPSHNLVVPKSIMIAKNEEVAAFIRGVFDAEGYVTSNRVSLTMVAEKFIKQLQMLLLRFGIIASVRKKISKGGRGFKESHQFTLEICDSESLMNFRRYIGFSSEKKMKKLGRIYGKLSTNTNQIPVSGKQMLNLVKKLKMNTEDFATSTNFFRDERKMSFNVFRRVIIKPVEKRLKEIENAKSQNLRTFRKRLRLTMKEVAEELGLSVYPIYRIEKGLDKNPERISSVKNVLMNKQKEMLATGAHLLRLLWDVYHADVIQAEIKHIDKTYLNAVFYDLTVPETECFVANNFILHNSSVRFERLIEIAAHEWFKKVGELANKTFSDEKIKGVIIGGPGPTKNSFLNADYLNAKVKQKIIGTIDTSYTDEFGIREMMQKAGEIMKDLDIIKEKQLVNKFLKEASTGGLATYGEKQVRQALLEGKVDTLLLSEELEWKRVTLKCPHCGYEVQKSVRSKPKQEKCEKCGVLMNITEEKDIVEDLSELAEMVGTKVEIISTDTPEGEQFFRGFGGIGAILRFR